MVGKVEQAGAFGGYAAEQQQIDVVVQLGITQGNGRTHAVSKQHIGQAVVPMLKDAVDVVKHRLQTLCAKVVQAVGVDVARAVPR